MTLRDIDDLIRTAKHRVHEAESSWLDGGRQLEDLRTVQLAKDEVTRWVAIRAERIQQVHTFARRRHAGVTSPALHRTMARDGARSRAHETVDRTVTWKEDRRDYVVKRTLDLSTFGSFGRNK